MQRTWGKYGRPYKIPRFFLIEETAIIDVVDIPLECSLNQCEAKRKENLLLRVNNSYYNSYN